jgi:hypothetical protein
MGAAALDTSPTPQSTLSNLRHATAPPRHSFFLSLSAAETMRIEGDHLALETDRTLSGRRSPSSIEQTILQRFGASREGRRIVSVGMTLEDVPVLYKIPACLHEIDSSHLSHVPSPTSILNLPTWPPRLRVAARACCSPGAAETDAEVAPRSPTCETQPRRAPPNECVPCSGCGPAPGHRASLLAAGIARRYPAPNSVHR